MLARTRGPAAVTGRRWDAPGECDSNERGPREPRASEDFERSLDSLACGEFDVAISSVSDRISQEKIGQVLES